VPLRRFVSGLRPSRPSRTWQIARPGKCRPVMPQSSAIEMRPRKSGSQQTCMGLVFVKIYGSSCGLSGSGAPTPVALFDQTDRCFVPTCHRD
jgi:hypothetical protein